jgi:HAE1 family hydrophobic/amphiphilic exporter-1
MSLSSFSIKKPATTIMIMIAMIFFGYSGLTKMPVEMIPSTSYPMARISIKWDGATPNDVNDMITKKIEDVLPNIDGITEYNSTSEVGESEIEVRFDYGTDIETKITLIQNEINQISNSLPDDIADPVIREQSTSGIPVMVLMMVGGDPMEMRTYANSTVKPLIERIDGVSQVSIRGGQEQEVLVEVDPEKLENYNIGIEEISSIISDSSVNIPGGILMEGEKEYIIKVEAELTTPQEISEIVLKNSDGKLLQLKDVADVSMSMKDRDSIFRNSGKDALAMIIVKADNGNSVDIVNSIKKVLKNQEGSLPINTEIKKAMDSSTTILNSIASVKESAYTGIILVSIILFIFLKNISATMVVAMSIPTSIIFTFFLLNSVGVSINIISLMGLSLGVGMLVDDSVVVIDNIFRRMTELKEDKVTASSKGASEVALPVITSSLTTIAVFLPIVFQDGILKKQFGDMSYSITFCLTASLIVAVMFVPMMCSKILKKNTNIAHEGAVMKYVKKKYVLILKLALRRRFLVVIGAILLFIASIFMSKTLGGRFLPSQDKGNFAVIASLPSGADIKMADRIAGILEEKAEDIEYANNYSIMGDTEDVVLNIDAGLKTLREESMYDIMQDLRKRFQGIPDASIRVVPDFVRGGSDVNDLEFNLYSDNSKQLEVISEKLKEKVSEIPGLTDVTTSFEGGKPEGRFIIDREKAKYYGVSVSEIAKMIGTQINGDVPITINSDNDEIDVTVQLKKEYRESSKLLLDSRITLDNGKSVRISDVANYTVVEGPSKIEKKDKKRKVTLYANLEEGADLQSSETKIISELNKIGLPDGVTYSSSGDNKDRGIVFKQLGATFMMAVFLIYFILVWQFESFVFPLIIIFSIPLSTMGAIYGLYFTGRSLDAMVFVGIVLLTGIVVNNAIVLIDFINQRIEAGDSISRAVITSGVTRLRPILMTTMTTVLGMVPLAISNGEGAEMYNGMAFVVIFGLSVSTLLTLVIIPSIYYIVEDVREWFILTWKKRFSKDIEVKEELS